MTSGNNITNAMNIPETRGRKIDNSNAEFIDEVNDLGVGKCMVTEKFSSATNCIKLINRHLDDSKEFTCRTIEGQVKIWRLK